MNNNNKNQHCSVNTAHAMLVGSNSPPKPLLKQPLRSIWGVGKIEECNFDVVDRFRHTIKYDNTLKRYNVNLPFKQDHSPLSDNYDLFIECFKSLQKKLSKDRSLLES